MARWKLTRLSFGNEEFTFLEGEEVSLGRGINNTISLSSIVVSRNHCLINVNADNVLITDLKSSNGIYVGLKKIPPNIPFSLEDSDVIGIGWTKGAPVANIKDHEKYMFKLTKEKPPPITSRLTFQSDIESEVATINGAKPSNSTSLQLKAKQSPRKLFKDRQSPILNAKPPVKRKIENSFNNVQVKKEKSNEYKINEDVISIPSDSESEEQESTNKKQKLESNHVNPQLVMKEADIKTEKEDEYDVFKVKQEHLGYDDEPIQIDSESDDESVKWLIRLSQSSPGKPIKTTRESKVTKLEHEESSYSQIDDFEDYMDDLISIPPEPPEKSTAKQSPDSGLGDKFAENKMDMEDEEEYIEDPISLHKCDEASLIINKDFHADVVDGSSNNVSQILESNSIVALEFNKNDKPQTMEVINSNAVNENSSLLLKNIETNSAISSESIDTKKKAQVIEALSQPHRCKSTISLLEDKARSSSSASRKIKDKKTKKHSSSRRYITDSQKEERKRKLKDIATKEKEEKDRRSSNHSSTSKEKVIVNAKVTSTNRGAFLTDPQDVVKTTKRKECPPKSSKSEDTISINSSNIPIEKEAGHNINNKKNKSDKSTRDSINKEPLDDDIENKKKSEKHKKSKHKEKDKSGKEHRAHKHEEKQASSKAKSTNRDSRKASTESRAPLKSLKPLSESEDSLSGKPFSKVEPMPSTKPKKTVRFSEEPPVIHLFEIQEGNNMKKTSLAKATLLDARQSPVFSLEKIYLLKILHWSPQWLDEQMKTNDPPPIIQGNPPMAIFHSFQNHSQYVQVVGDLLLMEIWECLTQGYMRIRNQSPGIQMRIASLPPIPSQDRYMELFNISVNVSVPNSEMKSVPRMGEMVLVYFGPDTARIRRFFYVHNVRTLPSPPNNRNSFYCISLHGRYTDKMKSLKLGELMIGLTLAYIQKELSLFQAMEQLAGSPLSDAILKPEPRHFVKCDPDAVYPQTQWTKTLNPSQKMAVHATVSAALSDRPSIQMVQGPPGTGKSRVICAMVMSYIYEAQGRRQQARGKVLICATSNAAVDELVIRLLRIRQTLPKTERFRMVRVGRAEAMHPRAHDISSQQLAQREAAARQSADPAYLGLDEEISHLQAKINMWRIQEQDAKDPVRAAYCKSRVKTLHDRIALVKKFDENSSLVSDEKIASLPRLQSSSGGAAGGGPVSPEQLLAMERSIIEGADIVVTTLASAQSHKLKGLRRRIALCIVDEAGQAIEPESLIPLTLDVTRLALVGDTQQLPGFICSQRAKKHGLGESLFYRLTSCADQWGEGSPVILLNQQYRMQFDIADYPNRAFYGSRIQSLPPPRPPLEIPPYSIVCISSGDKGQGASGANEMEAWGVARLVVALYSTLKPLNLSLAVITPYSAHKELIKRNLRQLQDPSDGHIEVNTVDSFQGQERDVVVASLARSQGMGFLTDAGRMNVMLTRARHALLVCLNPHAMLKNYQWRTLVEDAQKRNLYRSLPYKICQGMSAGPIPHSDVLNHVIPSKTSR